MIISILVSIFTSLAIPADTSIHTSVEAQAFVSDAGVTPFWMRSLQYGSVPIENPGLVLRAWNGKSYNLKKKYDWKYEVEATGWTGIQNNFWLTQAYVSARRGKWELWAGRRKEVYGLGDTTMTGGFYAWSGNALPMPKIQLGTRDYLNFAKNWLGVHMTYSHGWFDNQGPTIDAYLHQKSLYGRIGKPDSFINIFGGINHQVSWGGKLKIHQDNPYPSSLNAYFYVVTVLKDRTIIAIDENTSIDDAANQYGNHLGSIDIALKFNYPKSSMLIYKQSAYETGRIISLTTINDGLWGISYKSKSNKFLQEITIEHLYTSNQGIYVSGLAQALGLMDTHYPETENYFNNGGRGGWAYWGKGIGAPLIVIDKESKINGFNSFTLNAVNSIYFSGGGKLSKYIKWRLILSISKHGKIESGNNFPSSRYIKSLEQKSLAILLTKYSSKRISYNLHFGQDQGENLINSISIAIGAKLNLF